MNYNYPIRSDWSTDEIITVAAFYEAVEKAYETGIARERLLEAYRAFKKIVPSMAEEKTLFKEFDEASGYVCFKVVKSAKEGLDGEMIKGTQR